MAFTEKEIIAVIEILVDKKTANDVIRELKKTKTDPYTDGQYVIHTTTERVFAWRSGSNTEDVRPLNQSEVGDGFTPS